MLIGAILVTAMHDDVNFPNLCTSLVFRCQSEYYSTLPVLSLSLCSSRVLRTVTYYVVITVEYNHP
jgi:hypothetical protein